MTLFRCAANFNPWAIRMGNMAGLFRMWPVQRHPSACNKEIKWHTPSLTVTQWFYSCEQRKVDFLASNCISTQFFFELFWMKYRLLLNCTHLFIIHQYQQNQQIYSSSNGGKYGEGNSDSNIFMLLFELDLDFTRICYHDDSDHFLPKSFRRAVYIYLGKPPRGHRWNENDTLLYVQRRHLDEIILLSLYFDASNEYRFVARYCDNAGSDCAINYYIMYSTIDEVRIWNKKLMRIAYNYLSKFRSFQVIEKEMFAIIVIFLTLCGWLFCSALTFVGAIMKTVMILFPQHALKYTSVYLPKYRKDPTEAIIAIKEQNFHTYTDRIFTTEFDRYCFAHLTINIILMMNGIYLAVMIWFYFKECERISFIIVFK